MGQIDFVLMKKNTGCYVAKCEGYHCEGNQHVLVVVDMDMKKLRNLVRRTHIMRRKISLLKDVKIKKP